MKGDGSKGGRSKIRYVIYARKAGSQALLHYTEHHTFSVKGRAKVFSSVAAANLRATALKKTHAELSKFELFVRQGANKTLRNPSAYVTARDKYLAEIDAAAERFADFTGRAATKEETFKVPTIKTGFALGKIVGVIYEQDRGEGLTHFRHDFKKESRPLLVASVDGTALGIVGGRYKITNRGIEDA